MNAKTLGAYLSCIGLLLGCNQTTAPVLESPGDNSHCVENFEAAKDYFPVKVQPQHAQGFSVEYHGNYKLVTVKQPWEDARQNLEYLLVQCGTPVPDNYPNATVVEIPSRRVLAMSTTYLPHIEKLDQLDRLVGIGDRRLIYSPDIRTKISEGQIQEVGDLQPDGEKVLSLEPDLILSYRLDDGESSRLNTLKSLGVTIVLDAAHLEPTPLGRAEWLKFTALVFNQEAKANQEFAAIAQRYQNLQQKTQAIDTKPTILSGSPYQGIWYVPAGDNYFAQFFKDAGGEYLWKNSKSRLSLPLDFEAVLVKAQDADIWINANQAWQTKADLLQEDERYRLLQASQTNQVFVHNARLTPEGGNDFWESGTTNPDIILADLIKIFHPEILPEHQLYYYRQVQ